MASSNPADDVDDAQQEQLEELTQPQGVAEKVLASTPWYAIAIMVHVVIIAIASVVYMASKEGKEEDTTTAVSMRKAPPVLPAPIETVPEPIDRNSVPVLPDQQEGPVNPSDDYIPDAAPGKQGEITDEVDPTKEAGIFNPDPEALSNLPSGATGGTPIGVGSVGHHGTGVPSAFASRRAGGGGKGGGGLGQGGGGGRGGTNRTEAAVMAGLLWLKNHQSPDGRWDSDAFDAQCTKGKCDGRGEALNDVGLTGLALLCFLGAGDTHVSGPFQKTVKNGLKFLMSVQDPEDGCFGQTKSGQHFQYNHACAALAMAEAYGMTQTKLFQQPAQKGLDFVMKSRNPYKAWRYAFPPDGDNDVSVTGWMVMCLKSGKMAGLQVEEAAIKDSASFIDELTDTNMGRTGYHERGTGPAREPAFMEKFPPDKSEAMTAVAMLVRIFAGHTAGDDPLIGKGSDLLLGCLPKWDESSGVIDMYYWYYGTLSMFQVGGRAWDKWNEAIKTAIIDHQHMDKALCSFGSWDPVDPWSAQGGRIYSTALNTLCMEVYYRYPRVFGMSKSKEDPKAMQGK
jgi:hypothetical protein